MLLLYEIYSLEHDYVRKISAHVAPVPETWFRNILDITLTVTFPSLPSVLFSKSVASYDLEDTCFTSLRYPRPDTCTSELMLNFEAPSRSENENVKLISRAVHGMFCSCFEIEVEDRVRKKKGVCVCV